MLLLHDRSGLNASVANLVYGVISRARFVTLARDRLEYPLPDRGSCKFAVTVMYCVCNKGYGTSAGRVRVIINGGHLYYRRAAAASHQRRASTSVSGGWKPLHLDMKTIHTVRGY